MSAACSFTARRIAGVPALMARRADVTLPAPAVLWFHGLGVDKETHRAELELLAREGFLAIGVDAAGHGERRTPRLQEVVDASQQQAFAGAVDFAVATAAELPALVHELVRDGIADPDRIALAGISMGALVVYRGLVECAGVARAVAILGTPRWPFPLSPHADLDAFCRVPLLSITAGRDGNVPPAAARELHRLLDGRCPARHRYVELAGAVHLMSAEHWEQTVAEMLQWLRPLLGSEVAD